MAEMVVPGTYITVREYHGNTWRAAPNAHLSRRVAPGTPFDAVYNVEQVVLSNPPSGFYEVIAQPSPANSLNQVRPQPFALIFVGSSEEARFGGMSPVGPIPFY